MLKKITLPVIVCFVILFSFSCKDSKNPTVVEDDVIDNQPSEPECVNNLAAGTYPCHNIDLVAHLTPKQLNGERLNDIWGWTDPETGKEFALVGLSDGVAFVDISSPSEPAVVGKLEESIPEQQKLTGDTRSKTSLHDDHEAKSAWRDFKVYEDHLFVVSDGQPHGMQVFDLTRLRDVGEDIPQFFTEDYHYTEFGNAHNVAINEETGFAYVVGSNTFGGGLHIIDIRDPLNPQFAGHHRETDAGSSAEGYVHDTQCVAYSGPDMDYLGDEICFSSSETHLVIANVADKNSAYTIALARYEGVQYAHQGWLTEDHRYFLLDDEFDESEYNANTRTIIWDVRDLDNPKVIGYHSATTSAIDHNQFIRGSFAYQANYTAGLRILSLSNITNGELEEVAYFDTQPESDQAVFNGAWSNYPFFNSGLVVVSDISGGLFILKPDLD